MIKIDWKILWKAFWFATIVVTLFVIVIVAPQEDYIHIFVYVGTILLITSAIYFFKTVTTDYFVSMLFGGVMSLVIAIFLLLFSILLTRIFGIDFLNLKFDIQQLKFIW